MMKKFLCVFAALAPLASQAYYGKSATEAEMSFTAEADLQLEKCQAAGEAKGDVLEAIDAQVQHLMGSFQSESFRKATNDVQGVLGDEYELKVISCKDGSAKGRKHVKYAFSGVVVFDQKIFKAARSDTATIPITLPIQPDKIYKLGFDKNAKGKTEDGDPRSKINLCTDEHYNSEGDFWYFWDPKKKDCPLARKDGVVWYGEGTLKEKPNTKETYPEYDRLYGNNGNKNLLDVRVFLGYIDDIVDPNKKPRKDDATAAFHALTRKLKDADFVLDSRVSDFEDTGDGKRLTKKGQGIANLAVFTKTVKYGRRNVTVKVSLLVSDTQFDTKDETFHRNYVEAMNEADIVVYDGHSGLGGNLDLKSMADLRKEYRKMFPKLAIDKQKYQIFFFNGCSSYPYYNSMYFKKKMSDQDPRGTENLDLVLSGLETSASATPTNAWAFLKTFVNVETATWQKILDGIERSNGKGEGTYLAGVKGDEDNEWTPAK